MGLVEHAKSPRSSKLLYRILRQPRGGIKRCVDFSFSGLFSVTLPFSYFFREGCNVDIHVYHCLNHFPRAEVKKSAISLHSYLYLSGDCKILTFKQRIIMFGTRLSNTFQTSSKNKLPKKNAARLRVRQSCLTIRYKTTSQRSRLTRNRR